MNANVGAGRSAAAPGPVVIGGVAGSGTRVFHSICLLAGYGMGWLTTRRSRDHWPLGKWFYPKWVVPYLTGELDQPGLERMRREFHFWTRLALPVRGGRWGWKNPPALYLLRFFDEMFPAMRVVHVLRDGRDQAFNPKFQYRTYQRVLMTPEEARLDDAERKALHWSRYNTLAESYGRDRLPGRYLQCRLEELCANPREEVARIFDFLQARDPTAVDRAMDEVGTPGSLGRWRRQPPEEIARVERRIGSELRHFGYSQSTAPHTESRPTHA